MRVNQQEILDLFRALIEALEDSGDSQDVISIVEDALEIYEEQD